MSILHIVRDPLDWRPLATARRHAICHTVSLLLLEDAVCRRDTSGLVTYASREDVHTRGASPDAGLVDYDGILDLLAHHERVISW